MKYNILISKSEYSSSKTLPKYSNILILLSMKALNTANGLLVYVYELYIWVTVHGSPGCKRVQL